MDNTEHLTMKLAILTEENKRLEDENKRLKTALGDIKETLNKSCGIISNAVAVGIVNEVLDD